MMLGFLKCSVGRLDESLEYFQNSLEFYFAAYGVKSEETAAATSNIGSLFYEMGDPEQALGFLNSTKQILITLDKTHPCLGYLHFNLGVVYL